MSVRQHRVARLLEQTLQNILTHHIFYSGPPSLALSQKTSNRKKHIKSSQSPRAPNYSPSSSLESRSPLEVGAAQYIYGSVFQRAHVYVKRVEVSRDLLHAKVFWQCLPGHEDAVKREFELVGPQIRTLLTTRVQLKYSPQLTFIHDTIKQAHIELNARLDQIEEELKQYPDFNQKTRLPLSKLFDKE
jgi:ribosome-binding factor A